MKKHWLHLVPAALCAGSLAAAAACSSNESLRVPQGTPGGGGGGGVAAGGGGGVAGGGGSGGSGGSGGHQPVTTPARYVRGSLTPQYALTPTDTYGNFADLVLNEGVPGLKGIDDTDFGVGGIATNQANQLDEIALKIQADNGLSQPPSLIPRDSAIRAGTIPFRGKPSDVKSLNVGSQLKLYAAMGGAIEAPWDEVAVISVTGTGTGVQTTNSQNIQVGLKPERMAVGPGGLLYVCNQYSNYVSIIDPTQDTLFQYQGKPVEIPTEYFCSDILFAPIDQNNTDEEFMLVANRWRHSVIKYHLQVQRDGATNTPVNVQVVSHPVNPATQLPDPTLDFLGTETFEVGPNPRRLALSDTQSEFYVANGAGGDVAWVSIGGPGQNGQPDQPDKVNSHIAINATTMDIVNINSVVYMPSSMIDRGLLPATGQENPPLLTAALPVTAPGVNGTGNYVVNVGPKYDGTVAYNFEDVRNGLYQLDYQLGTSNTEYYTDDISPEPAYQANQKILKGGLGQAIVRNQNGSLIFVANAGNDDVQAFSVNPGVQGATLTPAAGIGLNGTGVYNTAGHIPYGLALNEAAGQLYVADWGSEEVEVLDVASGKVLAVQELEFAQPTYPSTNVERGEFNFVNEGWSNNGRKSCASCHEDYQWGTDGLSFDNGAASPVTEHRVKMNANIADTAAYFWNGSFTDNNYASVAFDAQTKDNCRLIEFGIVEGIGSPANTRQGDPHNVSFSQADVANCQPLDFPNNSQNGQDAQGFVQNEQVIVQTSLAEQKVIAHNLRTVTGINSVTQGNQTFDFANDAAGDQQAKEELNREIDIYSVSNLRLPPNPEAYLFSTGDPSQGGQLSSADYQSVSNGQALFTGAAGCTACHSDKLVDQLGYAVYGDNLDHGPGADWNNRFFKQYENDPRILGQNGQEVPVFTVASQQFGDFVVNSIGGFPDQFHSVVDLNYTPSPSTINTYNQPIDYFIPFCFSPENCLVFQDPMGQQPNSAEESKDLALILQFDLGNADRGFNPGLLVGSVATETMTNTASLRGVWTQPSYLHHGYARSIREAILGPGHPALQAGEIGYAYDANAEGVPRLDVHGSTSTLTAAQVNDLVNFVQTIQ